MAETEKRNARKVVTGTVVSISGDKSITVKIDYGQSTARTTMGACGIKVWIYFGEKLPGQATPRPALEGSSRPRRGRNERRGR